MGLGSMWFMFRVWASYFRALGLFFKALNVDLRSEVQDAGRRLSKALRAIITLNPKALGFRV